MNKSKEFVLQRCKEQNLIYTNEENVIEGIRHPLLAKNNEGEIKYEMYPTDDNNNSFIINGILKYDPNASFDYFTYDAFTSDGTFMFIGESIDRIVKKMCTLGTFDNRKLTMPIINYKNTTLSYTIGDFVITTKYGKEYVPKDKPWLMEYNIIRLPIKFDIIF